jgi:predicted nucleic acid-binding protein
MRAVVVDASVIAAALFPETHSKAARALLVSGGRLHTPDLIHTEVANVIWKRHGRGEIDRRVAVDLLNDVIGLPLEIAPSDQLVPPALELAMQTGRTVYDCLYVALAVEIKAVMISNDRRLINSLASGPLKGHVVWLGEPS